MPEENVLDLPYPQSSHDRLSADNNTTLGQLAAKDLRNVSIFKKYGLDFCCGGKRSVKEACIEKGIDFKQVEVELQMADKNPVSRPLPYNDWNVDFLADYIVNVHHAYVKKTLPELRYFATKVARAHGSHNPELSTIQELVEVLNTELLSHTIKEEKKLFPYIKELVWNLNNAQTRQPGVHSGIIQNQISTMETEHESAGKLLQEIRKLSNDFSLPQNACGSYSALYRMLQEFETDLHIHIHLENNILFPKALSLEKELAP